MTGIKLRQQLVPPAPKGTPAASNMLSTTSLVLGVAPLFLLPPYLGLVGLLVGVGALRRHEMLARTAVAVCVIVLVANSLLSLFLYDLLAALLYQP